MAFNLGHLLLLVLLGLGITTLVLGARKRRAFPVTAGILTAFAALLGVGSWFIAPLVWIDATPHFAMDPSSYGAVVVTLFVLETVSAVIWWGLAIAGFIAAIVMKKREPVVTAADAGGSQAGRTNGVALASIIVVWFSSIVGLILGHVALGQLNRNGGEGRGMALTAVIVGWIATAIGLVGAVLLIIQYSMLVGR
ncbi:DUF4190 domain-containing protein [Agromyces sp. LHK192]|uniref:DUF4190 domain-containing protein n=1 Tax=Agromyces sp. LHK192 TaxID=2498704 RepID=UPI000FD9ECB8|nr:DUF4190 domain-containing protein [Agromyces sp. LHK192]